MARKETSTNLCHWYRIPRVLAKNNHSGCQVEEAVLAIARLVRICVDRRCLSSVDDDDAGLLLLTMTVMQLFATSTNSRPQRTILPLSPSLRLFG